VNIEGGVTLESSLFAPFVFSGAPKVINEDVVLLDLIDPFDTPCGYLDTEVFI
jgi:hypothetical protein